MNDGNNYEVQSVSKSHSVAVPIAIVFGFGLIAAAIFFSGNNTPTPIADTTVEDTDRVVDTNTPTTGTINPITAEDHIRGNPNAPIMLVEYSDYDCPFCKNFHETMERVINEYGADGKVAWVYRHMPLESLHPSAPRLAEAAECISKIGGNDAFWTFSDLIFGEREVNEQTNMTRLGEFAESAGVSEAELDACIASGEVRSLVEEDFNNGVTIGARGTPYSMVVVGDEQGVINGAQPYAAVKQIIDNLITQLEGQEAGT